MVDEKYIDGEQHDKNSEGGKSNEQIELSRQETFETLNDDGDSHTEELLRQVNDSVQNFKNLTNSERYDILFYMAEIMGLEATFLDDDGNIDVDCNDMGIGSFEDDLHLSSIGGEVWPISGAHFSLPNDNRSPNEYGIVDIYIHTDGIIRIKSHGKFVRKFTFEQWKQALDVANNCLSMKK